jgi:hypothetical protein
MISACVGTLEQFHRLVPLLGCWPGFELFQHCCFDHLDLVHSLALRLLEHQPGRGGVEEFEDDVRHRYVRLTTERDEGVEPVLA